MRLEKGLGITNKIGNYWFHLTLLDIIILAKNITYEFYSL